MNARRDHFLPFSFPSIGEEEIAEVVECLRSGWLTTGPKVKQFEEDFSKHVGARHAIAVSSCTIGMQIALKALGVGPGDEVIIPTITFCSSANVIIQSGATPILVDVLDDLSIDPEAVVAAVTPRTKAVIPVHYAGQACDLSKIYEIAARNNLAVIEDAAHAAGSSYADESIGSDSLRRKLAANTDVAAVTVFSFYATKNITTGEGGMIATGDDALAATMRDLTFHGISRDAWRRDHEENTWHYDVVAPGYKANMTDIEAAVGLHQLSRLDGFIKTRQGYAQLYNDALGELPPIETPIVHEDRNHSYHLYVIRLNLDQVQIDRSRFIKELNRRNIGASVHFIPIHMHTFYREYLGDITGRLGRSEAIYERLVSLPLYPAMEKNDVEAVIAATADVVQTFGR
jgi:dTDP-4-amino-4,6-dideoxygalactose transaminase